MRSGAHLQSLWIVTTMNFWIHTPFWLCVKDLVWCCSKGKSIHAWSLWSRCGKLSAGTKPGSSKRKVRLTVTLPLGYIWPSRGHFSPIPTYNLSITCNTYIMLLIKLLQLQGPFHRNGTEAEMMASNPRLHCLHRFCSQRPEKKCETWGPC